MIIGTIHLCEDCGNRENYPDCRPDNVQYGDDDTAHDNVIRCRNYSVVNIKAVLESHHVQTQDEVIKRETALETEFRRKAVAQDTLKKE